MQLSRNFAFLETYNPQLALIGTLAERYLHDDPNTCLIKLRQFGELLAQEVAAKVGLYISVGEDQYNLLKRLQLKGILNQQVGKLFHEIRIYGNEANHLFKGDYNIALNHLQFSYQLGIWYARAFFNFPDFPEFTTPVNEHKDEAIETEVRRRQETELLFQEIENKYKEAIARLEKIQENAINESAEEVEKTIHQVQQAEVITPKLIEAFFGSEEKDTIEGYDSISHKMVTVTNNLKTISQLIGSHIEEVVPLQSADTIKPGLGIISESTLLWQRAQTLEQGIFNLLVMGEFKNGKSTLLNAMLGEKKLLAKATPATAIITMLVYGDKDEVIIHESDSNEPRRVNWQDFKSQFHLDMNDQETLSNKNVIDRFKNIKYAEIQCQNSLCKNGVRLIDSPGLGEQISRTKVTTEFLKQSQAVIVVLNASQALTQEERTFIKTNFRSGYAENVFFVINMIDRVEEEEREEVETYFRKYLQEYFVDSQGKINKELCEKRIFFTDAKTALNARLDKPVNEALLEKSQITRVEQELENFLTSNQKFKAILSSTFDLLITTYDRIHNKIILDQEALGEPLIVLEQRRIVAEKNLKELEKREKQISNLINVYSQIISNKLGNDLERYLFSLRSTWKEEAGVFINLDEIDFSSMAKAILSNSERNKITSNINNGIQSYLKSKLKYWGDSIPNLVSQEIKDLDDLLKTSVKDFIKELMLVEKVFSGDTASLIEVVSNRENKIFQIIISLALGDFSRLPGTIMGDNDWGSFIWDSVAQVVMVTLILHIISGPLQWVVLIITEIGLGLFKQSEAQRKMVDKIGEKMFEEIELHLFDFQFNIRETMEKEFSNLSNQVNEVLQKQINEVREEQERIIAQKKQESFSIENERMRMEKIEEEVFKLLNQINQLAYGREYTKEEILWIAQGKNLMFTPNS